MPFCTLSLFNKPLYNLRFCVTGAGELLREETGWISGSIQAGTLFEELKGDAENVTRQVVQ